MAPHSSTLAWEILWMKETDRLQSMGLWRVGHDRATSLSLFTFMNWRRKWQPTPVFLPGESQGWEPGGLLSMGLHRVGHNWCDLAAAACLLTRVHPVTGKVLWCANVIKWFSFYSLKKKTEVVESELLRQKWEETWKKVGERNGRRRGIVETRNRKKKSLQSWISNFSIYVSDPGLSSELALQLSTCYVFWIEIDISQLTTSETKLNLPPTLCISAEPPYFF